MAATPPANLNYRTRQLGSSYTVWTINSSPIVWCVDAEHQSPAPVADAVPIQPMNYIRPVEIMTSRAISVGRIVLNVIETYGNKPWDYLNNIFGTQGLSYTDAGFNDLADVMHYMQENLTNDQGQSSIQLFRIIRTPSSFGQPQPWYVTEYQGVRIVDIRENEKSNVGAMQNNLTIEVMYTRKTDHQFNPGASNVTGFSPNNPQSPIQDTISGGLGFV